MAGTRREADSLGEWELPAEALYGVHTARAAANFPITGTYLRHYPELIQTLGMVKKAAALANMELGALEPRVGQAIVRACDRVIAGEADQAFIVDMVQGGAGTSTNMNANEVVANLALRELQQPAGRYSVIHPNDHVNLSQSTNDAYPSAVRLTMVRMCPPLVEQLRGLKAALTAKGVEFHAIIKVGRTQLMDAVPMRLGDEFRAFGVTIGEDIDRLTEVANLLREINLGGTAIGTGIN
ncbi:MAG: aspartate ammonia-lyase, partial [Alphaproteobacteria bacterium]|nr:aspartate ammonia-lyase [Alphaproteobacteria bacterium]